VVFATEDSSARLRVSTERVVVFKDGYCEFIKQAVGKASPSATAYVENIPPSMTLGSFWAVPKVGKLRSVTARRRIIPSQSQNEEERMMILQFGPGMADKPVDVRLRHFGPGIRWIPTYMIELGAEDQAELNMQAEVINEAENLRDVKMDLVVGVPNFRFKTVASPMSFESQLRNPLEQAAPQLMSQQAQVSNRVIVERRGASTRFAQPTDAIPQLPSNLAEGIHDLFVYHLDHVRLSVGERAIYPLISGSVPLRHVYSWQVHLKQPSADELASSGRRSAPVKLLRNEVWHQIELSNTTTMPWTTGAALIVQDETPVGQELLTYTAAGGNVLVPITIAIDVRGSYEEQEVGRQLKALHFDRKDYALISKKGTLRVTNYKTTAIDLVVTCEFGGNPTAASDGGKITIGDFDAADWTSFRGHPALTGHGAVRWEINIPAGGSKELTCEYGYYVH
jgi:hypothetical protein